MFVPVVHNIYIYIDTYMCDFEFDLTTKTGGTGWSCAKKWLEPCSYTGAAVKVEDFFSSGMERAPGPAKKDQSNV